MDETGQRRLDGALERPQEVTARLHALVKNAQNHDFAALVALTPHEVDQMRGR